MSENHVTALGHGEAKSVPDHAALTLTVTAQATDQAEAVRQNAEQTIAIRAVLREAGIADKDIQTQSYTVQPQYNRQNGASVLDGYWVQNSLQVTVWDLDRVSSVIDKAAARSALRIDYVSFGLSDRTQAEAEALSQAVVSAQRRASIMAAAASVGLGRLISMTEGTPNSLLSAASERLTLSDATANTPISTQQITVYASVTLVYALNV